MGCGCGANFAPPRRQHRSRREHKHRHRKHRHHKHRHGRRSSS